MATQAAADALGTRFDSLLTRIINFIDALKNNTGIPAAAEDALFARLNNIAAALETATPTTPPPAPPPVQP